MKKLLEITLGVVTSVGGYLEIGSIATSAEAGAGYSYQLIWCLLLGTLCIIFLVEMSGRFAAISKHTITDAIRERFGLNYYLVTLCVTFLLNLLVLASEIGGISVAAEFATGIGFQWWAIPIGIICWGLLWFGTFGLIEKGVSFLGLVTLIFVAAAVQMDPDWKVLGTSLVPSWPTHDVAHYWFLAVSILGATISPYLFLFYSSGAIEDKWNESHLGANRIIASLGMIFGAIIAAAVIILAALIFAPRGISEVDTYQRLPLLLTSVYGFWGFMLFVCALGIACLGATLEIGLQQAYLVAQGFGWNWGEDLKPRDDPGFALVYTCAILVSVLIVTVGINPLHLTIFSMAFSAASLPVTVVPFLFLMNDPHYLGKHVNGQLGNAVVVFIICLAFLLAVVTIPLELFGG
jgi:Mn2+/Fe2+ NRAMP family transporter